MSHAAALKTCLSFLAQLQEHADCLPRSIQDHLELVLPVQADLSALARRLEGPSNLSEGDKRAIVKLAKLEHHAGGVCEVDDDALISSEDEDIGDLEGVYVQAWVWVDLDPSDIDELERPAFSIAGKEA